ncbi:MAG: adenylate kinase family protein [Desulfurococcales archaeon]|nr:adenylate kinase family protein [Desulfurococcales archaeon]
MIIIITGTPGTGKTSISTLVSGELECIHIDVSQLVNQMKLGKNDPTGRQTLVLSSPQKVIQHIEEVHKKSKCIIIDTHYPSIFSSLARDVIAVFVLRTHPKTIIKRLARRGWIKNKVIENAEAELIGVIDNEAREQFDCVFSIDTTSKTVSETALLIKKLIDKIGQEPCLGQGRFIDWLDDESAIAAVLSIETGQS